MNNRARVEECARVIEIVRRRVMRRHAGYAPGEPGEAPDTLRTAVDFIVETRPTTMTIDGPLP